MSTGYTMPASNPRELTNVRRSRRSQNMTITGGCRCGTVRYLIDAEPLFARHCWCRDCQYIGAGSGTVNIFFPSEAVKVEGDRRLSEPRRQGHADAPPILYIMWDAAVHAGRPALYRRARGHTRRSRTRQASNHHLDLKRAKLGLLRSGPAARREAVPAGQIRKARRRGG